jgi:chemotaxis protein CheC
MIMVDAKNLSPAEFDALREVGNIGVGNATTALSKILNKRIAINIPETKFVNIEKFARELGGAEKMVVCLYLSFSGDISGQCLFAFSEPDALELVDLMIGSKPGTSKKFDEMGESAFMEMSNIFTGAYLSALANMLSMRIFPSVPHIANDMVQSVSDLMLIKVGRVANELLCVKAKINVDGHNINGEFIILFDDPSLVRLLDYLKTTYGI